MSNSFPSIGIIGEGKMGTNIFYHLHGFGFPITWVCSGETDLEKLSKNFRKRLKRSLDAGILDETGFDLRNRNIRITNQLSDLSNCDLIIEAVTEDLHLKRELFRKVDSIAKQECIFATNSSSIKPSELIPSSTRNDKFIGLHFFYPVSLKNIVELILPANTESDTIAMAKQFLHTIQRAYLVLDEANSFILNKIFLIFQNEAFLIVLEGKASILQMDELIKEHFFPFGAFDFMDSVGIPTMLASIVNYTRGYPDQAIYQPLIKKLREMSGKETFYSSIKEINNPAQIPAEEILIRLRITLKDAIEKLSENAGLSSASILHALNEYFGTDISQVIG